MDRTKPDEPVRSGNRSFKVGKKQLGQIIDRCIKVHGTATTAEVLDKIKAPGLQILHQGRHHRRRLRRGHPAAEEGTDRRGGGARSTRLPSSTSRGLISQRRAVRGWSSSTWDETTNKVSDALKDNLDEYNPIFMMADSGARGSIEPDSSAGRYARPDRQHLRYAPSRCPSAPTTAKA